MIFIVTKWSFLLAGLQAASNLAFYTQLNVILVASYLPVIFFFKMAIGGAVKCQN